MSNFLSYPAYLKGIYHRQYYLGVGCCVCVCVSGGGGGGGGERDSLEGGPIQGESATTPLLPLPRPAASQIILPVVFTTRVK